MYHTCFRGLGWVLPLAFLAGSGCANLEWQFPPPKTAPVAEAGAADSTIHPAVVADELVAAAGTFDPDTLIDRVAAEPRASEDDLLYQIGLLLLSPSIDDRDGAAKMLSRLVQRFPDSPRRRSADALLGLIKQLDRMTSDNASLREDLKKLLDIDLEAERQRRANP